MKKQKPILLILLLTITLGFTQRIEIKSSFWGYKFNQEDERVSRKELLKKLESDTEAFTLLKKANTGNTFYQILSLTGGAVVGIPLGDYIYGRSTPNWTLAYIGGARTVVSIPIYLKSIKNAKSAVSRYNSALTPVVTQNKIKPKLNFNINANGAVLALLF